MLVFPSQKVNFVVAFQDECLSSRTVTASHFIFYCLLEIKLMQSSKVVVAIFLPHALGFCSSRAALTAAWGSGLCVWAVLSQQPISTRVSQGIFFLFFSFIFPRSTLHCKDNVKQQLRRWQQTASSEVKVGSHRFWKLISSESFAFAEAVDPGEAGVFVSFFFF